MIVSELLNKRSMAKEKVNELKRYLGFLSDCTGIEGKNKLYSRCLSDLYLLFDSITSYDVLLSEINSSHTVTIGSEEIPVYKAVLMVKGYKEKIDTLTEVIQGEDLGIDIFNLIKDRDRLYDMYNSLLMSLNKFNMETTSGD